MDVTAVGNPGTGKSTILSTVSGEQFESGIAFGGGMTKCLHFRPAEGPIRYADTPGLADPVLKKQAADAIYQALEAATRNNRQLKLILVCTLEAGRIREADLQTMHFILNSIRQANGNKIEQDKYSVIINKVSKKVLRELDSPNKDDPKLTNKDVLCGHFHVASKNLEFTTRSILFLPKESDLEDEDNQCFTGKNATNLSKFIHDSPSLNIALGKVDHINTDTIDEVRKKMAAENANNKAEWMKQVAAIKKQMQTIHDSIDEANNDNVASEYMIPFKKYDEIPKNAFLAGNFRHDGVLYVGLAKEGEIGKINTTNETTCGKLQHLWTHHHGKHTEGHILIEPIGTRFQWQRFKKGDPMPANILGPLGSFHHDDGPLYAGRAIRDGQEVGKVNTKRGNPGDPLWHLWTHHNNKYLEGEVLVKREFPIMCERIERQIAIFEGGLDASNVFDKEVKIKVGHTNARKFTRKMALKVEVALKAGFDTGVYSGEASLSSDLSTSDGREHHFTNEMVEETTVKLSMNAANAAVWYQVQYRLTDGHQTVDIFTDIIGQRKL